MIMTSPLYLPVVLTDMNSFIPSNDPLSRFGHFHFTDEKSEAQDWGLHHLEYVWSPCSADSHVGGDGQLHSQD